MSVAGEVAQLLGDGPRRLSRPPVTGQVVKVDDTGPWVAPIGTATDAPIGPCYSPAGVLVGDVVLVVFTDAGPWVAQVAATP